MEKPLCVTPEEGEGSSLCVIACGRVVQVGYMKRFDPAVEALLDDLPPGVDSKPHRDGHVRPRHESGVRHGAG